MQIDFTAEDITKALADYMRKVYGMEGGTIQYPPDIYAVVIGAKPVQEDQVNE